LFACPMLVVRHAAVAYRVLRIPTKDRGILRTVADARDYILALPDDRESHYWEHTAKMILDQADVADVSRRVELALFYDGKLDLLTLYG
jgi:hypothetical protein